MPNHWHPHTQTTNTTTTGIHQLYPLPLPFAVELEAPSVWMSTLRGEHMLVGEFKADPGRQWLKFPLYRPTNKFGAFNHIHGNHSSEGKGDRRKRTSDRARTRDLRSIAEFQPREPQRQIEILRPPSLLCTGCRCAAIQRPLRPAPRGWYCVLCNGSRLSSA